MDRACSLRKIPTRHPGTNFSTSSACFAPSFVSQPNVANAPKLYEMHQTHEFMVQWGGTGVFVAKNLDNASWHELLHHFGLFSRVW